MKHLKRFNEGFELLNNKNNLNDFCKDNFNMNGFNISIGNKYISISSKLYDTFFKWIDIKDNFNKFLILLIDEYGLATTRDVKSKDFGKLLSIHLYSSNGYERIYSVSDFIDDKISVRFFIEEVRIKW
jgi:hypothetical protein